jgi:hypothetical protein
MRTRQWKEVGRLGRLLQLEMAITEELEGKFKKGVSPVADASIEFDIDTDDAMRTGVLQELGILIRLEKAKIRLAV